MLEGYHLLWASLSSSPKLRPWVSVIDSLERVIPKVFLLYYSPRYLTIFVTLKLFCSEYLKIFLQILLKRICAAAHHPHLCRRMGVFWCCHIQQCVPSFIFVKETQPMHCPIAFALQLVMEVVQTGFGIITTQPPLAQKTKEFGTFSHVISPASCWILLHVLHSMMWVKAAYHWVMLYDKIMCTQLDV